MNTEKAKEATLVVLVILFVLCFAEFLASLAMVIGRFFDNSLLGVAVIIFSLLILFWFLIYFGVFDKLGEIEL